MNRINLRALDCLRGLLAVYVLVCHSRWLLWCGWQQWSLQEHSDWIQTFVSLSAFFRFPYEAVTIFFCLSGFFIHYRVARSLASGEPIRFSVSSFFRRRLHRLAAPYFFALLLTLVCDLAGRGLFPQLYAGQTGDFLLDMNFSKTGFSLASIFPALAMVPGLLNEHFGSNLPLWSFANEVVYYALYPLWLFLRTRFGPASYIAILICPALGLLFPPGFTENVLTHYSYWLAGAALADICSFRGTSFFSYGLLAALFIAGIFLMRSSWGKPVQIAACLALSTSILVGFSRLPDLRSRFWTLIEMLGIRSYSIYVLHFPILTLFSASFFSVCGNRSSSIWIAIAGGLLSLLLTLLGFELVERRFLHRRLE